MIKPFLQTRRAGRFYGIKAAVRNGGSDKGLAVTVCGTGRKCIIEGFVRISAAGGVAVVSS